MITSHDAIPLDAADASIMDVPWPRLSWHQVALRDPRRAASDSRSGFYVRRSRPARTGVGTAMRSAPFGGGMRGYSRDVTAGRGIMARWLPFSSGVDPAALLVLWFRLVMAGDGA